MRRFLSGPRSRQHRAGPTANLDFDDSYELAERPYGETYGIGIRTDPDINEVEDFAVVLFGRTGEGSLLEITRIDKTERPSDDEEGTHIYRWSRAKVMDERDYDIDASTWYEADRYFAERVERFAKRTKPITARHGYPTKTRPATQV